MNHKSQRDVVVISRARGLTVHSDAVAFTGIVFEADDPQGG